MNGSGYKMRNLAIGALTAAAAFTGACAGLGSMSYSPADPVFGSPSRAQMVRYMERTRERDDLNSLQISATDSFFTEIEGCENDPEKVRTAYERYLERAHAPERQRADDVRKMIR